eukprot:TRINITY_DN2656_c0_g2_i1.p1 TRINITY_DN2656_c0_g2~~TRINITY_DN2656_c0_g2_i1.p1  ORF type:complete len:443 (-),score=136.75 TRINITY_DN2656_c0_g2_i1:637-1965(-)
MDSGSKLAEMEEEQFLSSNNQDIEKVSFDSSASEKVQSNDNKDEETDILLSNPGTSSFVERALQRNGHLFDLYHTQSPTFEHLPREQLNIEAVVTEISSRVGSRYERKDAKGAVFNARVKHPARPYRCWWNEKTAKSPKTKKSKRFESSQTNSPKLHSVKSFLKRSEQARSNKERVTTVEVHPYEVDSPNKPKWNQSIITNGSKSPKKEIAYKIPDPLDRVRPSNSQKSLAVPVTLSKVLNPVQFQDLREAVENLVVADEKPAGTLEKDAEEELSFIPFNKALQTPKTSSPPQKNMKDNDVEKQEYSSSKEMMSNALADLSEPSPETEINTPSENNTKIANDNKTNELSTPIKTIKPTTMTTPKLSMFERQKMESFQRKRSRSFRESLIPPEEQHKYEQFEQNKGIEMNSPGAGWKRGQSASLLGNVSAWMPTNYQGSFSQF